MNQNDNDNDEDMLVPVPKIETESIWLPLKRKRIFNINSKESSFILLRFFVIVSQCYSYQGINQAVFNRKLKTWIMENVLPFLDDDKLYPSFGAVLRILETIKEPNDGAYQGSKGKSSSRHNRINSIRGKINDEDYESLKSDYDNDMSYWIKIGFIVSGVLLLLILLICLCVKLCNKKFHKSDNQRKRSLKQKIVDILTSNTHIPERDEYYQYKNVARGVAFENEKQRKCKWFNKNRKSKTKDRIDLPLLGKATDSEDEIVLHDSSSSSKRSTTKSKNTKFGISESSDEDRSKKKPSKSSLKSSPVKPKESSSNSLNIGKKKRETLK